MRRKNLAMLLAIALGITSVQMPVMAQEIDEIESGIVDLDAETENVEDINSDTSAEQASDISSGTSAENIEDIDAEDISDDAGSKDSVSMDEISGDVETDTEASAGISDIGDPKITEDSSMAAGQKVTYDCIWFGSYPQAEIVNSKSSYTAIEADYLEEGDLIEDSSLYSKLQRATYNSSNETTIKGTRYRRMKESDATCAASNESGQYKWSDSTTYHYFKYEPIKWRVIEKNSDNLLLLADKGIDDKKYNEKLTDVTWETCTLRTYLNGTFYDNAFNDAEKAMIKSTVVENTDSLYHDASGGKNTTDKVFLLSGKEVYNIYEGLTFTDSNAKRHGFVFDYSNYDEARRSLASTYAKAMGAFWYTGSLYKGNVYWWIRSPGHSLSDATDVSAYGYVYRYGNGVGSDYDAVRPCLKIDISSLTASMYAGTVCTDGTKNEIEPADKPTGAPTGAPSGTPSEAPTGAPSGAPSETPTGAPSGAPTGTPSEAPTGTPSGVPTGTPNEAPSATPEDIEEIEKVNDQRDVLITDTSGVLQALDVVQAADDDIPVTENWVNGKIKSYDVVMKPEIGEGTVTVNAGGKFHIKGDVGSDAKSMPTFNVPEPSIKGVDGNGFDAKMTMKIAKSVNKKGIIAPKVLKAGKNALPYYEFVINYVGISGNEHKLKVKVVAPDVKAGILANKANMKIYSVPTNGKGISVIDVTNRNQALVPGSLSENTGIGTYKYSITNAEKMYSTMWMIGKTVLQPGKTVPIGHKTADDGKDCAEVTLSKDATSVAVRPIEGKAGAIKLLASINGKKYAINIKVLNK